MRRKRKVGRIRMQQVRVGFRLGLGCCLFTLTQCNSSDDGDKSDLSYVSAGGQHPNAERFEYLRSLGSQGDMPAPLQQTRYMDAGRTPLADRILNRMKAQKAERRALRDAEMAQVRLAASARRTAEQQRDSWDQPVLPPLLISAAIVTPTKAALAAEATVFSPPGYSSSVVLDIVHVPSHSPPKHPFFASFQRMSTTQGPITFSAVRIEDAVESSMTSAMLCDKPRNPRLKLKTAPTLSDLEPPKLHPSAAACSPSHLAFPHSKAKAITEPKTPSKTPSKLLCDDIHSPVTPSPSRSVKSSADKSSPLLRLNLQCLSQGLELLAVDNSPVSKLEAFRALMASKPGIYRFSTATQTDRVQQHSRSDSSTQTDPTHPSCLTVEQLRDELGKSSRALLLAFGF
jgi:hypothetical protein